MKIREPRKGGKIFQIKPKAIADFSKKPMADVEIFKSETQSFGLRLASALYANIFSVGFDTLLPLVAAKFAA